MSDARDIYQAHLDRVSRALWDRDYETVADCHSFPHVIRHPDTERHFARSEDILEMIQQFRSHLEGLGATGYHRVCERASFDPLDRNRITGAHWTYILRGGNYLTAPYFCEMVIGLHDDLWLVEDIVVPTLRHGIPTPSPDGTAGGGFLQ